MARISERNIHLYLTGAEARVTRVPFLLDADMRPITAINVWLRRVAQNGATSSFYTRRAYAYHLFDFFSYLAQHDIDWHQITNDTIIHYRDIQDQNPSPHTKKRVSRRTINARLVTVGRFYSFAAQSKFIDKDPVETKSLKIRRPPDTEMLSHLGHEQTHEVPFAAYERLAKPKIKWLPQHVVMEWLNSITDWRDKLLAKLLYRTGMRRWEIVNLRISQLPARNSVTPSSIEVSFEIIGKGGRTRPVYLAMRDFIELHDYIRTERARHIKTAKEKHDFVFVGRDGSFLTPERVNPIFRRISQDCDIEVTPHMLRHSFAVLALAHWKSIGASRPEERLKLRLGHANLVTTQIYMHLADEVSGDEAHANASLIELLLSGEKSG